MSVSEHGFTIHYGIRLPSGDLFRHPMNGEVARWSELSYAENVLNDLRRHAEAMGMEFSGAIVRSYATPFIGAADDGAKLIDELQSWLQRETGGRS